MSDTNTEAKLEDIPLADADGQSPETGLQTKAEGKDVEKGPTSDKPVEEVPLKKKRFRNVAKDVRKLHKEQTRVSEVVFNSSKSNFCC